MREETNNKLIQYIRDDTKEIKQDLKKLDARFDEATQAREALRKDTEEKFVTKEEFKPIKRFYNRLTDFSMGFIIFVGTIAIGAIMWLKEKFWK